MLPLDVRSDDSVEACVKEAAGRVGQLDVVVNNAGYELAGALEELSLEELSLDEAKAQFETNFFGVVRMVKAVLPIMRRQKRGQVVNVSSLSGLSPIPFMGIYSARAGRADSTRDHFQQGTTIALRDRTAGEARLRSAVVSPCRSP
jgi:short-subunit dehydrogenase